MIDSIAREVDLEANPAQVWEAISDPERLREWLAEDVAFEPEPGAPASFTVDGARRTGWVEEVCPPDESGCARLAFWWQEGDEPTSRVIIELEPLGSGTRLRVEESRPLEILDLVGVPLGGMGGQMSGPILVAA
jgi:uncharacterized protein YndB with AHSA1/START domain